MTMVLKRKYLESVINTYFEMGHLALKQKEYKLAAKLFKAIFEEKASDREKEYIVLPLLIALAQAYEGLKQYYKAKLLYIRALAYLKKKLKHDRLESMRILLCLARLTAKQGILGQSIEFIKQAYEEYKMQSNHNVKNEFFYTLDEMLTKLGNKARPLDVFLIRKIQNELEIYI